MNECYVIARMFGGIWHFFGASTGITNWHVDLYRVFVFESLEKAEFHCESEREQWRRRGIDPAVEIWTLEKAKHNKNMSNSPNKGV